MNLRTTLMAAAFLTLAGYAQNSEEKKFSPTLNVHGTVRAKYEYQTQEGEGRFEVRNARVSLDGNVVKRVAYKLEADFSDEGRMRMLDAYTRINLAKGLDFTIGQMRVPFTIDAHRSPHLQYFANRSFIAKQVGDVRDVGATLAYKFRAGIPITLQAGMFNGSGLTNQKDFWTSNVNFSAKAQLQLPAGFHLVGSVQKIRPDAHTVMLYDAGLFYEDHGLHIEAEYLRKHYEHGDFHEVNAANAFACYDIALQRKWFSKISPLLRYDYMDDHSDGRRYLNGTLDAAGKLIATDAQRSRLTGGLTFSFGIKGFQSDLRLNYEKYIYPHHATPKTSERDKIVCELMTHF